jgi:Methyltransferase domain
MTAVSTVPSLTAAAFGFEQNGAVAGPPRGRVVRDDPERPDSGFAELYGSLPDAVDLEPWLSWCRRAAPPVLYLGVGAGRLAVPLARAGVQLVGVDAHPGMLAALERRTEGIQPVQALIEHLELGRSFDLVIAPSNVLDDRPRLRAAARHARHWVALELINPHWLAAGAGRGVRVQRLDRIEAEIEVDYAGGWTQQARTNLIWPEDVESFLEGAGLELQLMKAAEEAADLKSSPSFYVLACKELRSDQMPSTY